MTANEREQTDQMNQPLTKFKQFTQYDFSKWCPKSPFWLYDDVPPNGFTTDRVVPSFSEIPKCWTKAVGQDVGQTVGQAQDLQFRH